MKIIVSPDSFKGSLSASQAAESIGTGVRRAAPDAEIVLIPLADGGEGTVESFVTAVGGRILAVTATGPMGTPVDAFIGLLGDGTAVVEMAAASGLTLVPDRKRDPMLATSYGTGELITAALDAGCTNLILGIGGSATNDGGIGMVQAHGGRFIDESGDEVGAGGRELIRVRSIDLSNLDPRLKQTSITVACDVENPLTGPNGASAMFGPQKGATPEMIRELDAGLHNLADAIRRDMGVDIENTPGAGAAGGMGAAAVALLGARLQPGIEIMLSATHFHSVLDGASAVFTGEGRVDSQTLQGKVINGVLAASAARRVPVIVLAGSIEPEGYELLNHGAAAVLGITDGPMSLAEAKQHAGELLSRSAESAMRLLVAR